MKKHNLGLVSVSFRENSPKEILDAMKNAKLSLIEWGSDIHAPCHDTERLHILAKLQEEYGIKCCSYGTYFRLGRDDLNELEKYAAAAEILGTDILRIWCGDRSADKYSPEEKRNFLEGAKRSSDMAEKLGVILCMECHNNSYTETIDGAVEIMEHVDSPYFRMYWQPNQFKSLQTNIEYAKRISPYVKNVHVFNWEGENKYPLRNATDTWKEYLSHFDEGKNLLLEFMPDGRIESLKEEAEALFRIAE